MDMNQLLCWDEFAVLVGVSWKSATSPQIVQCTHAENERVIWWMPQPTSSLFFFLSRLYHKEVLSKDHEQIVAWYSKGYQSKV